MKKFLIGLGVLVLLCCIGGPFVTGLVAERELTARVAAMDANNPWLTADVLEYDRGWFRSHVVIGIAVQNAEDELLMPEGLAMMLDLTAPLPVAIDIGHGPISYLTAPHIGMAQVIARPDANDTAIAELTTSMGVPYLFEFRGRAGFGRRFDFDADVPPFDYSAMFGEVRFSGLAVNGETAGETLSLEASFEELGLQGALAAGAFEAVQLEMTYEFRSDDLPLGEGELRIARAVASSPLVGARPLFELDDFSVTQRIELAGDGETIDAQARYSAARFVNGEGESITDTDVGIRIDGIDSRAMSQYYEIVNAASDDPAFDPDRLAENLSPVLDALVRRGFEVDVEPLQFTTADGNLNGDISLAIDGASLDPAVPIDVRNIAVVLGVLQAQADLTATKALARQLTARAMRAQLTAAGEASGEPFSETELDTAADAQAGLTLAALAGQGMLADDGDDYSVTLRYDGQQLTVNGNPLGAGLF